MGDSDGDGYFGLVGTSDAMRRVVGFLERVRWTALPVLLEGGSGTGKDLVARLLHDQGARAGGAFVAVHCGALPAGLVDSALFGHVRGAFTGAVEERRGAFEAADGGTLYLDDVGALPREVQPRLLRVLGEGCVQAVGATDVRRVDVRVIASLREGEGALLRVDLFHRIATLRVRLPSLAERREDIPLLVRYFARRYGGERGARTFGADAVAVLVEADYRGEVRQLAAIVQAALVLTDEREVGEAVVRGLLEGGRGDPREGVAVQRGGKAVRPLADVEREAIRDALVAFEGNKKRTAEALGIDRSTLYAKVRRYGLGTSGDEA